MRDKVVFLMFGLAFGLVLSRSGAADYNFIQGMFLLTNLQLFGIIGVAVAITLPGLWLLKRRGTTLTGQPINIKAKPFHKGNVLGGALFGIGWSLTGMCPGPIIVNIGEGKLYALAAFAGVMVGTYVFGRSYSFWQKHLGLPVVQEATGCG